MNTQNYRQLVNTAVERKLKEMAEREANSIVANLTRRHSDGRPAPQPPKAAEPVKRVRIRNRAKFHPQFAPKDSWLALGRNTNAKPVRGQLAQAMIVADNALAVGPADRPTLTKLMMEAAGWTRVQASGCISRLVTAGRLVVVSKPRAS